MKHWVQSAVIASGVAAANNAAAQDVVVEPPPLVTDGPPTAPAPARREPPAVGGEGRWVFDLVGGQLGSSGVGPLGILGPVAVSSSSSVQATPEGEATYAQTTLSLAPSFDTFVADRFSVGGRLEAGLSSTTWRSPSTGAGSPGVDLDMHGHMLGAAPRVGYAIPISSTVAFWPRIGVGYQVTRQTNDVTDRRAIVRTLYAESTLGLGLRLSKHVLLDLGPVLSFRHAENESSDATMTVFGAPTNGSYDAFDAAFRASLRVDL